jgi:hypothetical protein
MKLTYDYVPEEITGRLNGTRRNLGNESYRS